MEKQDQGGAGASGGAGGSASQNQINSGSSQHTISLEEKKQRIHHNIALAEFFKNKYTGNGTDPYDLLNKLKDLHQNTCKSSELIF